MLNGGFIQSKQVNEAVPFRDPLKMLKLKTLASDCVIKKGCQANFLAHLLYQVIYVKSFSKRSNLKNLVNH